MEPYLEIKENAYKNESFNINFKKTKHKLKDICSPLKPDKNKVDDSPQMFATNQGKFCVIRKAPALKGIAFQGGGGRGITLPSGLKAWEKSAPFLATLEEVSGTSSGAIFGGLLATGYPLKEAEKFLANVQMCRLMNGKLPDGIEEGDGILTAGRLISMLQEMLGSQARIYLEDILADKLKLNEAEGIKGWEELLENFKKGFPKGLTFKELETLKKINPKVFKTLHITGFNTDKNQTIFFNNKNYPNMPIHEAIRISMAVPLIFKAVEFEGHTMTDGGEGSNVPIEPLSHLKSEEIAIVAFDREGESYNILHGPMKHEGYCGCYLMRAIANKILGIFGRHIEEPKGWYGSKPSFLEAALVGRHYMENQKNDSFKIHEAGPQVFVMKHGKLDTFSFLSNSEEIVEATLQAALSAESFAEQRKDQAIYSLYDDVSEAVASLSRQEKEFFLNQASKQIKRLDGKIKAYGALESHEIKKEKLLRAIKEQQFYRALSKSSYTPSS